MAARGAGRMPGEIINLPKGAYSELCVLVHALMAHFQQCRFLAEARDGWNCGHVFLCPALTGLESHVASGCTKRRAGVHLKRS